MKHPLRQTMLCLTMTALLTASLAPAGRAAEDFFALSDEDPSRRAPPVDEFNDVPVNMMGAGLSATGLTGGAPGAVNPDGTPAADGAAAMTIQNPAGETVKRTSMADLKVLYAEGKYEEILVPLGILAKDNNGNAQEMLGLMHELGQGVTPDPKKAAEYLLQAADNGRPLAQHHLAIMHYSGQGVEKDSSKALMWLVLATLYYPPGPEKDRAMQDRKNLEASITRRERDSALFMAREWLEKRGEGHLMSDL